MRVNRMANRVVLCILCAIWVWQEHFFGVDGEILKNGEDTVLPPCNLIDPTRLDCHCDKGQQIVEALFSNPGYDRVMHVFFDSCDVQVLPLEHVTAVTIKNLKSFNLPILNLPHLEELMLENISFLGTLSRENFQYLSNLKMLTFESVNLSRLTKSTFEDLTRLESLVFQDSELRQVDEEAVRLKMAPISHFQVLKSRMFYLANAFAVNAKAVLIEGSHFDALLQHAWKIEAEEFSLVRNRVDLMQAEPLLIKASRLDLSNNTLHTVGNNPFKGIGMGPEEGSNLFFRFQNNVFKGSVPKQGLFDFDFESLAILTDRRNTIKIEGNVMPCSCELQIEVGLSTSGKPSKIKTMFYYDFLAYTQCYASTADAHKQIVNEYIETHCHHQPEPAPIPTTPRNERTSTAVQDYEEYEHPEEEEEQPRKPFVPTNPQTTHSTTTEVVANEKRSESHKEHPDHHDAITGPVIMVIIALGIMVAILIAIFIVYRQKKEKTKARPPQSPHA